MMMGGVACQQITWARQKTDEGPGNNTNQLQKRNGGGQGMAARRIKKEIRDRIVTILKKYDAERIAIFGSYARGEAGKKAISTSLSGLPVQKALSSWSRSRMK